MNQIQIVKISQSSHAAPRHSEASMHERADGTVQIAWQAFVGGDKAGRDDSPTRIMTSLSNDRGKTWDVGHILAEPSPGEINIYSPSFVSLGGRCVLFLFFAKHPDGTTSGYAMYSQDEGATFGERLQIWNHRPFSAANHVAKRLPSGRIVYPICIQTGKLWTPTDHNVASLLYSDDNGMTWTQSNCRIDLAKRGAMEPHVEVIANNRLMMVMRTQLGTLYSAILENDGQIYSQARSMPLQSPESCPELVKVPNSDLLLVIWNNSPFDPAFGYHYGRRSPLSFALSDDHGETWSVPSDIESDPNFGYTNPACLFLSDGSAIITYFSGPYSSHGEMQMNKIELRAALIPSRMFENTATMQRDMMPQGTSGLPGVSTKNSGKSGSRNRM